MGQWRKMGWTRLICVGTRAGTHTHSQTPNRSRAQGAPLADTLIYDQLIWINPDEELEKDPRSPRASSCFSIPRALIVNFISPSPFSRRNAALANLRVIRVSRTVDRNARLGAGQRSKSHSSFVLAVTFRRFGIRLYWKYQILIRKYNEIKKIII